eukprot:jgi/Tetstr1/457734/TSEL_044280.t1
MSRRWLRGGWRERSLARLDNSLNPISRLNHGLLRLLTRRIRRIIVAWQGAPPPATAPSAVADAVVAGCCEEVALDIGGAGTAMCCSTCGAVPDATAPSHKYRRRHPTPAALTTNRHVSFGRWFIRVGASAGLGVCRRQSCEAMDTTSPPGQKWAASLVVSRVRAAGIEEDEKDMRKRVTRFVRERRKAHLNAKASTVPAAQLVVAEEAASSAA